MRLLVSHRSPPPARTRRRFTTRLAVPLLTLLPSLLAVSASRTSAQAPSTDTDRPRARELGVVTGVMPTGRLNAITDVEGVRVGQVTVVEGDSVRTGVTAVLPHGGNLFREKVPGAVVVGNGFGKLLGVTQVRELGEIETPILLTCTLCVWRAADAMVAWLLEQPGMEGIRSINPVVGETNDGYLNDIRARPIRPEHVVRALESASGGPVAEGAVGAGAGTVAFGWKGGIGTSSRALPASLGGWTVGALVQSNYGGILTINGAPVGRELGQYSFRRALEEGAADHDGGDGSIMIVVATDAPLGPRGLERLAHRALAGLARTGSIMSNGSGDYVLAFSTADSVRRTTASSPRALTELPNDAMSPLFQAAAEATEEAIYNSLFKATTTTGHRGTIEALPLPATRDILQRHRALTPPNNLPSESPRRERGAPATKRAAPAAKRGASAAKRGASAAKRGASAAKRGAPASAASPPRAQRAPREPKASPPRAEGEPMVKPTPSPHRRNNRGP